jgi:hypothetical protein
MSKGDEMKVSSETAISMPMKNLLSIVAAVAVGVWAYFGVIERLNRIETNEELLRKDLTQATQRIEVDLEKNTEFRIKWPRGEMGTLPADSEQYMLIEHIAGQVEKIQERMENMMNNGVNINRLQKDVESLTVAVEGLKDSNRNIIFVMFILFVTFAVALEYKPGKAHPAKEGVIGLLLKLKGKTIEHVFKPNLSACMKSKRIAQRQMDLNNAKDGRVQFVCKILVADLEEDSQTKYGLRITKIISGD